MKKIAGVILSGGQSSRMGEDKALLKIGKSTLLEHTKALLNTCGIEDIYISRKGEIEDEYLNMGPISGILASLNKLVSFKHILFTPVDMPLLNREIIEELITGIDNQVTSYINHPLPLFIKNSKKNRIIIDQQLKDNKLSIKNMITQLSGTYLTNKYAGNYFLNMNTVDEYMKVKNIMKIKTNE